MRKRFTTPMRYQIEEEGGAQIKSKVQVDDNEKKQEKLSKLTRL